MVIAPPSTGKERTNKKEVTSNDQTYRGKRFKVRPAARILKIVVIKLIAPRIDAAPDKCKLNIAKSTEGPECACTLLSGGYTVHPVPAPDSTNVELTNNNKDGGNNQKDMLFILGKAMSTAPIIIGKKKFPNPPIIIGITIKKIIRKAWPVTNTLYSW
jgi:hypothetical protein